LWEARGASLLVFGHSRAFLREGRVTLTDAIRRFNLSRRRLETATADWSDAGGRLNESSGAEHRALNATGNG
jgi:hypothetical protein